MPKKQMTREDAIAKLRATRQLSTDMLAPLGISFESFLRYDATPAVIDKMLAYFDASAEPSTPAGV